MREAKTRDYSSRLVYSPIATVVDNLTGVVDERSSDGTVHVCLNPKQPFSQADCEQFCYRGRGDNSRVVFTAIDHITQTLHYSNARLRFGLIEPRLMEVFKCISGTAFSLLHRE